MGDVDGDGEYEIILKWDPSNAHDNAHDGYTGHVYMDCYRLNGEQLWRIDLGRNVRAGAHYTQFIVFDLDGDNKAEVVIKTGDGTIDGTGTVIGDPNADYRSEKGRILSDLNTLRCLRVRQAKNCKQSIISRKEESADSVGRHEPTGRIGFACVAYLDGEYPAW